MVFQEPKIEFVGLNHGAIMTLSGPAAEYCKQNGDTSMTVAQYCYTMTGNVNQDWQDFCWTFDDYPDTDYRPVSF